jgi:hypothetical protein
MLGGYIQVCDALDLEQFGQCLIRDRHGLHSSTAMHIFGMNVFPDVQRNDISAISPGACSRPSARPLLGFTRGQMQSA